MHYSDVTRANVLPSFPGSNGRTNRPRFLFTWSCNVLDSLTKRERERERETSYVASQIKTEKERLAPYRPKFLSLLLLQVFFFCCPFFCKKIVVLLLRPIAHTLGLSQQHRQQRQPFSHDQSTSGLIHVDDITCMQSQ